MFLHWFRHRPKFFPSGGASFWRIILLVVLFAGMCWAFWANSERYVTKFSAAGRFQDEVGGFSEAQKAEIIKILGLISKNVQVKVHVQARKSIFTSPEAIDGEVLVGLCPEQKQVVIFMPQLWRNAVGEGFIYQLRNEMVEPGFEDGTWPERTIKALLLMQNRFESLMK